MVPRNIVAIFKEFPKNSDLYGFDRSRLLHIASAGYKIFKNDQETA